MTRSTHRGFVPREFILAYCTECGDGYELDEGMAVFESIEQASHPENGIASGGWRIDGDRITCDNCIARTECAVRGHDWADWWNLTPRPRDNGTQRQMRYCERCWTKETEVLP